ncbi:SGNH/GDSL hydrolase family protein [Streptomyces odontomachi]|uniref:SGNH/GDSL hydrolase family protein n=1 Tax=Streptomyces odontomachi TaxID=2944940 RepID=UPI00210AEA19|nr:SGNH/GDSL hydrolase family protein [Streptomyces sp. ODS25]
MTKRHAGRPGREPRVRNGAMLAAVLAVVVGVSSAIYYGVSGAGDNARNTMAEPHPTHHNTAAPASAGTWVTSWSASPTGPEPGTELTGLTNRTVRNVVHCTAGGTGARVTLSNLYGQQPLTITHATLALAAAPNSPATAPGTLHQLTFNGGRSVVIPAGQQEVSDALPLRIPSESDLLISTYSSGGSGAVTFHAHARQVSYAAVGDHTEDPNSYAYTQRIESWRYLTALDVLSNEADGTVVVLGDSLTDGITSTAGANHRWTDHLAARLREENGAPRYSVANEGISGNRILTDGTGRPPANLNALTRFRRDVLDRTGVKAVVVAVGVNDVLHSPQGPNADRIVEGLRELTRRSHAHGLRVVGATLMPFGGHLGYTNRLESVREAVNQQIRTGRVFDAFVDFDRALRDPYNPRKLRPQYDSGDHLHPSDAGYFKMADVFNLSTLKGSASATL